MNEFEQTLREQVDASGESLQQAAESGLPFEIHLHSARLLDLIERAHRHGIDATGWLEPELLVLARDSA